jgi:HSP20 family molecular chaperone IbpA
MATIERVPVALNAVESFENDVEEVYKRVTEKAYESYLVRGCAHGHDLEDWLRAETALITKPPVDVRIVNDVVILESPIGYFSPDAIQLRITPDSLLIASLPDSESRQIFRIVHLPALVDVRDTDAVLIDGTLRVTAALARHWLEVRR